MTISVSISPEAVSLEGLFKLGQMSELHLVVFILYLHKNSCTVFCIWYELCLLQIILLLATKYSCLLT